MKVTVEINPQQAVRACKVIAELARTQNYFASLEGKGSDGPFAMDYARPSGWVKATDEEVAEGILLALARQHFQWTTTAGNQVRVWADGSQWYCTVSGIARSKSVDTLWETKETV